MNCLRFTAAVLCLALSTGCVSGCGTAPTEASSAGVSEAGVQQTQQLLEEIEDLRQQVELLEEQAAAWESQAAVDREEEKLLDTLVSHPELIPFSPSLGGTFRFYRQECKLLNGRYAYAYAEDGHTAADLLYAYLVYEDGTVDWSLRLYDLGGGWTPYDP